MRIIAGKFRGKRIDFPRHIRPTQDKVRQSTFDCLRQVVEKSRVLDLFAGSGAFGLEALSRGAKSVCFIDIDRRCNSIINNNLRALGLRERAGCDIHVFTNDAFRAVEVLARRKQVFDIIFLDPPYGGDLAKKTLKTIISSGILAPHGFVLVEHSRNDEIVSDVPVELIKELCNGGTKISLFSLRS